MKIEIFLGFGIEGSIVYRQLQAPEGLCEFKSDKKKPDRIPEKISWALKGHDLNPSPNLQRAPFNLHLG